MNDSLPPNSPDAERAVLGCLLMDPAFGFPVVNARLGDAGEDLFYDLRHQIVFNAMMFMHRNHIAVHAITLYEQLKSMGSLPDLGGELDTMNLIAVLPDKVDTCPTDIAHFLEIVVKYCVLRKQMQAYLGGVNQIESETANPDRIIDKVERELSEARSLQAGPYEADLKADMERIRDEMEEAALGHVVHNGLPTGLPNLDKLMKGLRPGRMIVIGGFTSQGKTTLALNIAAHVALCHAQHIGIFSLEMKSKDLMENITSSLAKVNYDRVCSGQVTLEEATRIKDSMIKINQCLSLIHIDDTRGLSMKSIKGKSQVMSRSNGIKLLVIDYLQLVRSNRKFDVREQEVADTSREIKELSGELDIPVIVLSQLNEEGKLRESRAIGHDADTIWILEPTKNAKLGDEVIPVTLKINKNRKGPTGQIALEFQNCCCLFEEEPLDAGPDQPGLPYKD